MFTVEEALERILAAFEALPDEAVALTGAAGRTLAADVQAAYDLPPFDNSAMDGFALRAADSLAASADSPVTLTVVEDIPAGYFSARDIGPGEAARILTGAPVPPGADCVIPVEDTDHAPGRVPAGPMQLPAPVQFYRPGQVGQHIRRRGEDVRTGQTVLSRGRVLRPADLGVLAGLGRPTVRVISRPRVAILSTGDELLEPGEPLGPGQIYDMNAYTIAALVEQSGAEPIRLGIARDTLESVEGLFAEAARRGAHLILSSAGVSVGAFDVVKAAVEAHGQIGFWKVNLRPGKPLAFGRVHNIPFLGLPGNPVSAIVTFDVFARPALLKMMGRPWALPSITAELAERMTSDGRRTYARVTLRREGEKLLAYSTGSQSSGVLTSLVYADGLLILPEGVTDAPAGSRFPVRLLSEI